MGGLDWDAFSLSLQLAAWTCVLLLPLAIPIARWLAWHRFRLRGFVEGLIALPLVLPPTVLGYYLLVAFSANSPLGSAYASLFDRTLPSASRACCWPRLFSTCRSRCNPCNGPSRPSPSFPQAGACQPCSIQGSSGPPVNS